MDEAYGSAVLLDELAAFGPFFALQRHPGSARPAPPWRPMRELIEQPDVLLARIDTVRAALAAAAGRPVEQIERKVAASVTQLGLVARLSAPAVAWAVVSGRFLDVRLSRVWWQNELGGAFPISIAWGGNTLAADRYSRKRHDFLPVTAILDDPIEPLTVAVGASVAVSARVLWGNVASALNSAAAQVARQRSDLAERAYALATTMLSDPRLSSERSAAGPDFRRASCCLIYRVAAGRPSEVCGDCVLNSRSRGQLR